MKNKRVNGNVLIAFILVAFLAVALSSLFFVLSGRLRSSTAESDRLKALYVAEAGIHKAIWYIVTPTSQGGRGTAWRTPGTRENFGDGFYTMTVLSATSPGDIVIFSSGEVSGVIRKVQVEITASSLPAAFDYAFYNNGNLTVKGSVSISGDVFANGNATVNNPASITGNVYVPEGNTISGSGTYGVGGTMVDPPQMPFLDTSSYDGDISEAKLLPAGDRTISDLIMGGQIIYVNGNATIGSNVSGSGRIVASGDISFAGDAVTPDISYISDKSIKISGNTNVKGSILFGSESISVTGSPRIQGSLLSASVSIAGTPSVFGIVYAWEIGVTLGTANIYGSVINPTSKTLNGNISVVYDPAYLPTAPPPGMTAGGYRIKQGSWKELSI